MNPFLLLAAFALYPLAKAAKEDFKDGMVSNVFSVLIFLGAVVAWVLYPDFMWANVNLAGLVIWVLVLAFGWYSRKKAGVKMLGLADIYLGLGLTLLLGMWSNFVFGAMSLGLFFFLITKIYRRPMDLKEIIKTKTRLVPFYLIGLVALIILLFFK